MMAKCIVCGNKSIGPTVSIISDDLAKSWKLSKYQRYQFNLRESRFCSICGSSTRIRFLATAIMRRFRFKDVDSFKRWTQKADEHELKIAEINSCGSLHTYLKELPNLKYSEFTTKNNIIKLIRKIRGTPYEDIQALTYKNDSFDLVIHTEVLEHIPNPSKALKECRRILKKNGSCIFSIPIIMNRRTVQRMAVKNNQTIGLKSPSYHGTAKREDYIVWWEFGRDFFVKEKLTLLQSDPPSHSYIFETKKP